MNRKVSYQALIIAERPVSYWPLDELGGTTAFDRVGSNHGTYTGGYILGQAGPGDLGTAALLTGTDGHILVSNHASLQIVGDLSLEFWFYSNDNDRATVFSKHASREFELTLESGGPGRSMNLYQGNTIDGTVNKGSDVPVSPINGQWEYCVVTRQASTRMFRPYRGGKLISGSMALAGTNPFETSTNPLKIGSNQTLTQGMNARICHFAIYNYVLTPEQIAMHAAKGDLTPFFRRAKKWQ